MRRLLIRTVMPVLLCVIPLLSAILIAAVIPPEAMSFFAEHLTGTDKNGKPYVLQHLMDVVIIGIGLPLFLAQIILCWLSLQWRGTGFNHSPDKWVNNLSQTAEWFPMLGLLGTVGGILQTFASLGGGAVTPAIIIEKYAPAITATGCGLYMAFINILPPWIVMMGRDLITSLGGGTPAPAPTGETP